MTRTAMDKTAGEYFQEPPEQKHLLKVMAASLGRPHVGNFLLLVQSAPIDAFILVLIPYMSTGPIRERDIPSWAVNSFHGNIL
jgi:hypothetical protein